MKPMKEAELFLKKGNQILKNFLSYLNTKKVKRISFGGYIFFETLQNSRTSWVMLLQNDSFDFECELFRYILLC
jgi:hypothetical protein